MDEHCRSRSGGIGLPWAGEFYSSLSGIPWGYAFITTNGRLIRGQWTGTTRSFYWRIKSGQPFCRVVMMGKLQRLCFQNWLSRAIIYACYRCQVSEFLNIDSVLRADHPLHTVLNCGPRPNGRTQNFLIGLIEYKISLLTTDRKSVTRLNGALKHYAIIDIHQFGIQMKRMHRLQTELIILSTNAFVFSLTFRCEIT